MRFSPSCSRFSHQYNRLSVQVCWKEDGNSGELRWGNIHVVAVKSQMIRHIIEDGCAGTSIPLPNVTAKILSKVIEAFHAEFVKENQGIL
ncbi:hypothetical protein SASPL_118108 [Salvia splendens]|uniref:SKP1 component POZ domain-containing protein n=1 Tax=Salvia splendens TaxID=180675 RepID=A0A8X8XZP5_SALSN|nr:hypothetical protein SASPL_118108 [Salvia splendens]